MAFNPSRFFPHNVSDTCAVWNLLSSSLLYSTALKAGCSFCCTSFVHYECLLKPRKNPTPEDLELQRRFREESTHGQFKRFHLEIEDLQDVSILQKRKNLGKGELSSIAFARKLGQALITDDQSARKLASQVMESGRVQTTPHIFGWLCFGGYLDTESAQLVIQEHDECSGRSTLRKYFELAYAEAEQWRQQASGTHKR